MRKIFAFAGALVLISACTAPNDSVTSRSVTTLEARVGELETRVASLEASSSVAGSGGAAAPSGSSSGAAAAPSTASAGQGGGASTTDGYEGVYIRVRVEGAEAKVLVNGRIVGAYTKNADVYLDSMLNRGAMNHVSFAFSAANELNSAELQVKSRGDERWSTVFNFTPTAEKLESGFDVPYIGAPQ